MKKYRQYRYDNYFVDEWIYSDDPDEIIMIVVYVDITTAYLPYNGYVTTGGAGIHATSCLANYDDVVMDCLIFCEKHLLNE